jgi:hypothetical protein
MRQSAAAETGAITFVKPSQARAQLTLAIFYRRSSAFIGGYMFLFR